MDLEPLIDTLSREEILEARRMRPEDKLLAGAQLFDQSCEIMVQGIRDQHPSADEREVYEMLESRLELVRRLENGP